MALTLAGTREILAATHNPGKARELEALLSGQFIVRSAAEMKVPEPEETESTFVGNALLKARHGAAHSGMITLADDSGLCVWGLGGDPGIYSARWAGPGKDFSLAIDKIAQELRSRGTGDLSASFFCALAVAWPDGPGVVFEGRVDGDLSFPPRGERGFGYDPVFVPQGFAQTFGEMDPAQKDAMSHRARAFESLRQALM